MKPNVSIAAFVLLPAVSVSKPVISPVPSATTTCNSSPAPLPLFVL